MSWKQNKEWKHFKQVNTGKMGVIVVKVAEIIMKELDKDVDIDKINAKQLIKDADKYGEVTRMMETFITQAVNDFHPKGKAFLENRENAD
jgi:hypothetical protein